MNLHEELGRVGASGAAGSRERLASAEVADGLGARVRRGRRQRALGGAGVVAGVALVAVGVWGLGPLGGHDGRVGPAGMSSDPAPTYELPEISGATTYTVDESASVSKEVPIDLRLPNNLVCGVDVQLDEGATVHDPPALPTGVVVSAASRVVTDGGDTVNDPSSVWEGYESHAFETAVASQDGSGISTSWVPLLLRGSEIVGIGVAESISGGGAGGMTAPDMVWTPPPGACADGETPVGLHDGVYQPVLVTQVWSANLQTALATIVVSAGDLEYTGVDAAPGIQPLDAINPESGLPLSGDGYLARVAGEAHLGEVPSCDAALGVGDLAYEQTLPLNAVEAPVPSWLPTGRLYGYGDDALVGGYPIPLIPAADAEGMARMEESLANMVGLPAMLVLRDDDGTTWVFDAAWSQRDDLPLDDPGWFLELNQDWDCGTSDLITPGTYDAWMIVGDAPISLMLQRMLIVDGVPGTSLEDS